MLLNGVNHVAVLTKDSDRFHTFYRDVFEATVSHDMAIGPGMRLSIVDIGPSPRSTCSNSTPTAKRITRRRCSNGPA